MAEKKITAEEYTAWHESLNDSDRRNVLQLSKMAKGRDLLNRMPADTDKKREFKRMMTFVFDTQLVPAS